LVAPAALLSFHAGAAGGGERGCRWALAAAPSRGWDRCGWSVGLSSAARRLRWWSPFRLPGRCCCCSIRPATVRTFIRSSATRSPPWMVVHVGTLVFVPLLAGVVFLLLRGVAGVAALLSRVAGGVRRRLHGVGGPGRARDRHSRSTRSAGSRRWSGRRARGWSRLSPTAPSSAPSSWSARSRG